MTSCNNYRYDRAETRPSTLDARLNQGRAAVDQLSRRFRADRIRGTDDNPGKGSVFGVRLLANFVAGKPSQLVRQVARPPPTWPHSHKFTAIRDIEPSRSSLSTFLQNSFFWHLSSIVVENSAITPFSVVQKRPIMNMPQECAKHMFIKYYIYF